MGNDCKMYSLLSGLLMALAQNESQDREEVCITQHTEHTEAISDQILSSYRCRRLLL